MVTAPPPPSPSARTVRRTSTCCVDSIGTDRCIAARSTITTTAPETRDLTPKAFAGVQANGTVVNLANQAVPASENPSQAPFLVCYNCHVYAEYGSVYFSNTAQGGREGSHAEGDHTRGNYCNGPYGTSGTGRATTYTAVYGQLTSGTPGTFQGITNFNFGRL